MEPQHRLILISGIISAVIGLVAGFSGGRFAPHPALTPDAGAGRPRAGPGLQTGGSGRA